MRNPSSVELRVQRSMLFKKSGKGATIQYTGGGAGVFVAWKLFISTGLDGALKISHFITCLYRTVIEVNYLFHAESARIYLFQKNPPPPPLEIKWWPPKHHHSRFNPFNLPPSKQEKLTQCQTNVGQPSTTLGQH